MNYRRLGRSGLKVSELSFGSWVTYGNQLDTSAATRLHGRRVGHGRELLRQRRGVRAAARASEIMGEVLKKLAWPRLKYVVSTKFFWGITDGPNEKNTLNRKYLMNAIDGSLQAPAARARGPRLLPPARSRHAHRGDGVGDARHDRARQGALLGHLRMERRRDHGGLADRRAPPPAQARRGAAAVQPLPPRRAWRREYAPPLRATSASASRRGARSPRGCSPASTARAFPRTAAAPSRA